MNVQPPSNFRPGVTTVGIRLHINLETFQPLQNCLVRAPSGLAGTTHRLDAVDGITFHIEVDCGVSVCRCWACMSEPLADCGQIHTRLQEGDGSAVPHAVWVKTLANERCDFRAGAVNVFGKNVSNPESRQMRTAMVEEHLCI